MKEELNMATLVYAAENDCWKGRKFVLVDGSNVFVAYTNGKSFIGCGFKCKDDTDFDLKRFLSCDYTEVSIKVCESEITWKENKNLAMLLSLDNGIGEISAKGIWRPSVSADFTFENSKDEISVSVKTDNGAKRIRICKDDAANIEIDWISQSTSFNNIIGYSPIISSYTTPETLSLFIEWAGEDAIKCNNRSFFWKAIAEEAPYGIFSLLADRGFRLDLTNHELPDPYDIIRYRGYFDISNWLTELEKFSKLIVDGHLHLARKQTYDLVYFLIGDFPSYRISRGNDVFFPTIDWLRKLDVKCAECLSAIVQPLGSKTIIPDDYSLMNETIRRDFYLFPESLRLIAGLGGITGENLDRDEFEHYEDAMLPTLAIDILKERDDSDKPEIAALLYYLIVNRDYIGTAADDYIMKLYDQVGTDYRDSMGYTAFLWSYRCASMFNNCYDLFVKLVENGAEINTISYHSGRTVLYNIVKEEMLDPFYFDRFGYTKSLFEYLLLKGADPSIVCEGGNVAHLLASIPLISDSIGIALIMSKIRSSLLHSMKMVRAL